MVEAMAASAATSVARLRVDGGASVMDSMLAMQADQLGVVVERPVNQQTTVMGAAFLAGVGRGSSLWMAPRPPPAAQG